MGYDREGFREHVDGTRCRGKRAKSSRGNAPNYLAITGLDQNVHNQELVCGQFTYPASHVSFQVGKSIVGPHSVFLIFYAASPRMSRPLCPSVSPLLEKGRTRWVALAMECYISFIHSFVHPNNHIFIPLGFHPEQRGKGMDVGFQSHQELWLAVWRERTGE